MRGEVGEERGEIVTFDYSWSGGGRQRRGRGSGGGGGVERREGWNGGEGL
jgi:hypothetical protein